MSSVNANAFNANANANSANATHPRIVSIEGNIGSGKSTFLEHLRTIYKDDPTIGFVPEPVDIWDTVKDSNGKTILEKYYSDQKKYAFSFQMMAFISRLTILREAIRSDYKVIIIERSIYTDAEVFAKMLFDDQKIEDIEYNIYMKWFVEFTHDLPPIDIVYVRADPDICLQRVLKRSRQGEEIPLEYLENCHKYHETWLNAKAAAYDTNVLVLDANTDIKREETKLKDWVEIVSGLIRSYSI
jgi:deoxyadenosine/deoxycytidine kinase